MVSSALVFLLRDLLEVRIPAKAEKNYLSIKSIDHTEHYTYRYVRSRKGNMRKWKSKKPQMAHLRVFEIAFWKGLSHSGKRHWLQIQTYFDHLQCSFGKLLYKMRDCCWNVNELASSFRCQCLGFESTLSDFTAYLPTYLTATLLAKVSTLVKLFHDIKCPSRDVNLQIFCELDK